MTPEEKREYNKAYKEANKERIKAQDKAYKEANKEQLKAKSKEYYEANKDYLNGKRKDYRESIKEQLKAYHIQRSYGLNTDEYETLLENGCHVCGTKEGRLCVDHDHSTGLVRGCLCHSCNISLGHYENTILPNLDKFTQYLRGTLK